MKTYFLILASLSVVLIGTLSYRSQTSHQLGPRSALLVEFKTLPTQEQLTELKNLSGVTQVERFDEFPSDYFRRFYHLEINQPDHAKAILLKLANLSFVKKADQSFDLSIFSSFHQEYVEGAIVLGAVAWLAGRC